jgi:hypothetical protein
VGLAAAIVTAILAVLGVLTLISQLLVGVKWPPMWSERKESRRWFFILLAAVVSGSISGVLTYRRKDKSGKLLSQLFNLEIKLIQLEGLVLTAISVTPCELLAKATQERIHYIKKYRTDVSELLIDFSNDAPDALVKKLKEDEKLLRKEVSLLASDLASEDSLKRLHEILAVVGDMRLIVKNGIEEIRGTK